MGAYKNTEKKEMAAIQVLMEVLLVSQGQDLLADHLQCHNCTEAKGLCWEEKGEDVGAHFM